MQSRHAPSSWLGLVGWAVLVFVAAGIGGIGSMEAPTFYAALERPRWAPPAGVFGPVWTVLYALMAVAAWLVWRETDDARRRPALILFVIQLVLNALWSWLFFKWQTGEGALAGIALLLAALVATLLLFWRVRALAGWLLVPYLAWVSFATALTWSVWQRNPAML
jgi:benzodiazapine receptor